MKLGLVRRGYAETGGAEAYLRRFADAAVAAGHECVLFTADWPRAEWPHAHVAVKADTPRRFADALAALRPSEHCDFLFSFERVWKCDAYRAGDGVHAAWLERRAAIEPRWQRWARVFNRKHPEQLALEAELFRPENTRIVIANSQMVKREIGRHFAYPAERIHVIYNGVPAPAVPPETRAEMRRELGLDPFDYVALFAGSGWDRKGLRFAIEAMNAALLSGPKLLVAGRGNSASMPASTRTRFLGPRRDIPRLLAAADVFILPTIYDPFSNACLEALASGLPVFTTSGNGFAEIIEPGVEGEVVERPDDSESFARAVERWAPPDRRVAVRDRLRAKGAGFSVERSFRETLAVIAASPVVSAR
jgi:UDP-glucose:(heptosyl)LPS alpha-1,3-glucosyltransferase